MKISYNWLREYVNLDLDPGKIAEILTNTGLEVESLEKTESVKGGLSGVVIGEVMTCQKHPGADKLSVTTVDIGDSVILPIVCGAPNVAAGQKVVVATIGTVLYQGDQPFEIKKAKIRGEISEGMICAEDELGLGDSHAGIMVLPDDAPVGMMARDYFNIEDDHIFEIGLTPNRTDAMSHMGVARDLIAAYNFTNPGNLLSMIKPCVDGFKPDNNNRSIEVVIEDTMACPRYSGLMITGVEVKESPEWLKNRLIAVGLRPINNLVDISNYILHETGHPTHFFDADKITGNKVIIKKLQRGYKFVTLDGIERELTGDDLMICNESEGMCLAGVFGGLYSGVTAATTSVFIESAYFEPGTIRRTSRYHGLNTDSSFRFERGADPNMTIYALKRAAMLISQLAGGTISSEIIDIYPNPINNRQVKVLFENIYRLIGKNIDRDHIVDILFWLGLEILEEDERGFVVEVPTFKSDVRQEPDIIEEILRIYGYNNVEIPAKLRSSLSYITKPDREFVQNMVSDYLTANGFTEVINNSLTRSVYAEKAGILDPNQNVRIKNPLSMELNVLRQTMLLSGLETISYNTNRRNQDLKIFEFGKVYWINKQEAHVKNSLSKYHEEMHLSVFITGKMAPESWYKKPTNADFYLLKSYLVNLIEKAGINFSALIADELMNRTFETGIKYIYRNKEILHIGMLCPSLLQLFDINQEVYWADLNWDLLLKLAPQTAVLYYEVAKYPEVRRDLALLVDQDVKFTELRDLAFDTEKNILKQVSLFDIYQGDKIEKGKKSYAISFILQDERRTLTDKIIDRTMQKLVEVYKVRVNAILR